MDNDFEIIRSSDHPELIGVDTDLTDKVCAWALANNIKAQPSNKIWFQVTGGIQNSYQNLRIARMEGWLVEDEKERIMFRLKWA
jgi:hypothetical protein